MNLIIVFLFILCVRLASVFIVQTYYVPDEYWQSLEVAHKLTFGYGYLTWEWIQGIRSYLYPLVIAGVYKFLALIGMDSVQLLTITPRILQAMLTAYSDYRFFIWSKKRKWALFIITISYFQFYMGSRTLLNTVEASLTTIALSFFPWQSEGAAYLWLVALICYIRPTAAIVWIPLCVYHLRKTRLSILELVLKRFLLIGLTVAGLCVALDSYLYGKFIVTPYEFVKYNVFHGVGSFYGTHPWYWYFTAGLPTVLGINTLPFIFGIMETIRHEKMFPIRKHLLITVLLSLFSLSIVEHKEFRFLASLMPLCFYICADTMSRWSLTASKLMLWLAGIVLVVANIYPAYYLGRIHQSGPIELMPHLQKIAKEYRSENNHRASFLFLMPCHSTPYFSHIHENITMRFLTCEPNLKQKEAYIDEADEFYKSPNHWLRSHIPSYPRTAMPSHVILFEPLLPKITEFIKNYNVSQKIFMADYSEERVGNHILVYDRLPLSEENLYNKQSRPDDARERKIGFV